MGYPQRDPGRPPGPYFALVGCVGTPKRSVPTRLPKALWCVIEIALDLVKRLSPSFHCPWLSVVAVWWSLVRFRRAISFLFFGQICCFLGQSPCSSAVWVHPKKRLMGIFPWVRKIYPNAKNRAPGVENDPFCDCRLGTRGRFLGRTGRFEPLDVT